MVECGIEKYDKLPNRVSLIDVDAHRAALNSIRNDDGIWAALAYPGLVLMYHRLSADAIEKKAIENLEDARKIHNGEMQPFYAKWWERIVGEVRNTSTEDDSN